MLKNDSSKLFNTFFQKIGKYGRMFWSGNSFFDLQAFDFQLI